MLKHGATADRIFLSSRDGVLYFDKFPALSVYHDEPRFLRHWPRELVSTELVAAELTGCG
eukprot:399512-Amphidinium_carterae.1